MHDHPKSNYAFLDDTSISIVRLEEQASTTRWNVC
jgi:hypothetical protein